MESVDGPRLGRCDGHHEMAKYETQSIVGESAVQLYVNIGKLPFRFLTNTVHSHLFALLDGSPSNRL
jgi:hypothetical protein